MEHTYARSVVVGVDGSPGALVAARYALDEAVRHGLDLHLVYGCPASVLDKPRPGDFFAGLSAAGQSVLDAAVAALDVPAGVTASTQLAETTPAVLMRRLSESAQLMVVGQHSTAWYDRLGQGAMASPLAHRSGCPLVVVPPTWRQGRQEGRPVVVALDGQLPARDALEFAFDEAGMLGVEVVALHAVARGARSETESSERNVADLLAAVRAGHPGTDARLVTARGDPRRVMLAATRIAAVLVVDPPHTGGPAVWSRAVARRVMTGVECPMVVVPSSRSTLSSPAVLVAS